MSHPLIERGRDVEAIRNDAAAVAGAAQSARSQARSPGRPVVDVRAFNQLRASLLDEYRQRLYALDRAILDFNLTVPDVLHKHRIRVDKVVEQLAADDSRRCVESSSLSPDTDIERSCGHGSLLVYAAIEVTLPRLRSRWSSRPLQEISSVLSPGACVSAGTLRESNFHVEVCGVLA